MTSSRSLRKAVPAQQGTTERCERKRKKTVHFLFAFENSEHVSSRSTALNSEKHIVQMSIK